MHFQLNMPDNGRKNIFKDRQTTKKVPVIFLDVKVSFLTLAKLRNVQCMYLAFKKLLKSSKKCQQ